MRTFWQASWPRGCEPGQRLPLLVSLHGYDSDHQNTFTELHLDEVLTQVVEAAAGIDGVADYEANNVWTGRSRLAQTAARIDCGTSDGFYPAAERFAAGCSPQPAGSCTGGGHDTACWQTWCLHNSRSRPGICTRPDAVIRPAPGS